MQQNVSSSGQIWFIWNPKNIKKKKKKKKKEEEKKKKKKKKKRKLRPF